MQFQLNATVYFDGIQIYEAGLVIIEQNIDGKWACLDDKLVCKVFNALKYYGREHVPKIWGYYITKDGSQVHLWSKRPSEEFRQSLYSC